MIIPPKWILKRPGILIPVFFLSLIRVSAQISCQEAAVLSQGNTFVTRKGFCNASHNQAGLGWVNQSTLFMEHSRPFAMEDLGISLLGMQLNSGNGAFGTTLSTTGISGLRQTSLWISYGMKLSQGIAAGLGLHFWTSTTHGQTLFHPGASFAIGIQVQIDDRLMMGAHVMHPVGWYPVLPVNKNRQMMLATGFAYTVFETLSYSSELHVMPLNQIRTCHGIELKIKERIRIQTGMHNQPFAISGGVSFTFSCYSMHVAFEYMIDSGLTPISSLSYAW